MDKPCYLSLTLDELADALKALGQPAFRAKQVFSWLHKGATFQGMSNLPKALRDTLQDNAVDIPLRQHEAIPSRMDDTVKFLFALTDGNIIESVLMHYHYGYTLCVSTQVGCRMGCAFCASTLNGCVRSLEEGEILAQILLANHYLGEKGRIGHVVLMGSGEPLDNYDNVVKFLRLVNDENGLNISLRNVSLSTCGLVPQIRRLSGEGLPVTLSISLHAPNDGIRNQLMPISKRYPMDELLSAVRDYVKTTGRRVVFEYALVKGLNASVDNARELASRIGFLQCHVNLIPLNHVKERSLAPASPSEVQNFLHTLEQLKVSATVRREMGDDIGGACGQLRNQYLKTMAKADTIMKE